MITILRVLYWWRIAELSTVEKQAQRAVVQALVATVAFGVMITCVTVLIVGAKWLGGELPLSPNLFLWFAVYALTALAALILWMDLNLRISSFIYRYQGACEELGWSRRQYASSNHKERRERATLILSTSCDHWVRLNIANAHDPLNAQTKKAEDRARTVYWRFQEMELIPRDLDISYFLGQRPRTPPPDSSTTTQTAPA